MELLEEINCPICGELLVNRSDDIDKKCGYNWFVCGNCNIYIRIEREEN